MEASAVFLKKHQGVVDSLCQRYYSLDPAIDEEDFKQAAALALLELFSKNSIAPATQVFREARQAILKTIRQSSHLSKRHQRLIGLCSKNYGWLSTKLQRDPTPADYSKFLGISETKISEAFRILAASARAELPEDVAALSFIEQNS